MKRILLLAALTLSCFARPTSVPQSTRPIEGHENPAEEKMLARYAFAACLRAGGIDHRSVLRTMSFNLQEGRSPEWKHPQVEGCAIEFLASRASSLTTDLVVEKCLDFLESPLLAVALGAGEGQRPACKSDHAPVEPAKRTPALQ